MSECASEVAVLWGNIMHALEVGLLVGLMMHIYRGH